MRIHKAGRMQSDVVRNEVAVADIRQLQEFDDRSFTSVLMKGYMEEEKKATTSTSFFIFITTYESSPFSSPKFNICKTMASYLLILLIYDNSLGWI
jgi:hypothetical protein